MSGPVNGRQVRETVKVLVCGASSDRLAEVTRFLTAFDYHAIPTRSAERALEAGRESHAPIAIWLETDATARRGVFIDAAQALREITPGAESILIGPADTPDYTSAAFDAGVYNCMSWPADYANLARDLDFLRLEAQRRSELLLWSGAEREVTFEGLLGATPRMTDLHEQLKLFSQNNDPVLIIGPVGAGKELVASALHSLMEKAQREKALIAKAGQQSAYHPLMIHRCCGLTEQRADELFAPNGILAPFSEGRGLSEAGAGSEWEARQRAVDLLGFTTPGVLLIDEISDLPFSAQQKLAAWLLVNKAVRKEYPVRIVASSRCDLALLAENKKFHSGLLRLLKTQTLTVPALKDRIEDIPMLADSFLNRHVMEQSGVDRLAPLEFSREAQRALLRHDWPGNVRELKNVVSRAAMLAKNRLVEANDLGLSAPAYPPPQILDWQAADGINRLIWLN